MGAVAATLAFSIDAFKTFQPDVLVENPVERKVVKPTRPRKVDGLNNRRIRLLPPESFRKMAIYPANQTQEAFNDLMERFTPEEAMIICMVRIDGHSPEAVAHAFGESADAVRGCIIRAISRVRKEVGSKVRV